jgi:hypothetical protein
MAKKSLLPKVPDKMCMFFFIKMELDRNLYD